MMEENTDSKTNLIESLLERIEEYSRISYELFKLKAIDKLSGSVSSIVSFLGGIIALLFFIIILHVAVGLWLGEILGKGYYGFFCVAAFDAVLWIVLRFLMRNWLKKRISNSMISEFLN